MIQSESRSVGLGPEVLRYRDRGRRVAFGPHGIHVVDEGADRAEDPGEAFLLVHGFPESSWDFRDVLEGLRSHGRVVTLDLLGFGLSDKPHPHGYSLFEQADVIEVVLAKLGVTRAHVVAHDMGTSVATELIARRRFGLLGFEIGSLVLTNGSVYIEMASLTPSQKLLRLPLVGGVFSRLASWPLFRAQVRRIAGRPVREEQMRDMFELMVANGGRDVMPSLIGYVDERYRFAERWNGALAALDLPTRIVWGQKDPVAVAAIGDRLAREIPGAEIERLHDVGHWTPFEAAGELVAAALGARGASR